MLGKTSLEVVTTKDVSRHYGGQNGITTRVPHLSMHQPLCRWPPSHETLVTDTDTFDLG